MKKSKDNINTIPQKNGITITDSISLTFNSKYWINSRLILIITALAGVIGFIMSFLSVFDFQCRTSMLYTAEAMVFLVSAVLCMFPSKTKVLLFPLYILMGYGIYKSRLEFSFGYAQFINTIADTLHITSPGHPYYRIPEGTDTVYCLTLFMIFVFTVITTIICYNTIVKPRFIIVFSCTFPFIETGLMFGLSPAHTAFSLLISYWVAVFAMRVAGNQYHTESGKPVFVRRKNVFVSSGNLRNNVIEDIGIITLVSVFAFFIITSGIISALEIKRSDRVNNARLEIKTAISDLSVEKIANNMSDQTELNPVTERSQLGNLSKISFKNKTDLTVFISDIPDSILYLKGFTGSVYKNNTWYSLPESRISQNRDLFNSFAETGYYPQYFNYINYYLLSAEHGDKIRKNHMIVNSWFKQNKYAFTPYGVGPSDNLIPDKDAFFKIDNLNSYSYDSYTSPELFSNMSLIYDNMDELEGVVADTEKEYRDFVYSNYLLLPENDSMDALAEEFGYIPDYNGRNIEEIYAEIKSILKKNAEYSLEPGRTPASAELTTYFLKESHKGYCSHFATAAVVLARLNGVPARYTEGYIVIPPDFKDAETVNAYYKLDIHDSRAHAWAEFYIDGFGWVPFEFTPGYAEGIISAENSLNPEAMVTLASETVTEPPVTEEPEVITEIVTVTEIVTEPAATDEPEQEPEAEPENSETDENGDGTGNDSTGEKAPAGKFVSFLLTVLRIILSAAITVFLIAALIFARHVINIRNRVSSFRSKSNNKSMSAVYSYTLELLAHAGINKSSMLPLEFAEYTEEHADGLFEEGSFTDLVHTMLKAGFSNEEISTDELRKCEKTANTIAHSIYQSKSKRDRLIFRYILNLCR